MSNSISLPPPIPKALYRVQYERSFTQYHDDGGDLTSNANYSPERWLNASSWFNEDVVLDHIDWRADGKEATPFISLFDNLADAIELAIFHQEMGYQKVFIAEIEPASGFDPYHLHIQFENFSVDMRGIVHSETSTMFFSMQEISYKLAMDPEDIKRCASVLDVGSEWLAICCIPSEVITGVRKWPLHASSGDDY